MEKYISSRISILMTVVIFSVVAFSQNTEFTYQGSFKDGASVANGSYDFEFKLYDALTGPTLIGTRTRLGVQVTNGVFAVTLDFSPSAFNGTDRFLEIAVKPAGGGSFTTLNPRQPINHAPYSFRSLNAGAADTATNANQLGGIAAGQYVLTSDARLSDARPPTSGSGNYVQNRTSQQASTDFNISGDGTAGGTLKADIVNAVTQFNTGGSRALSTAGTNNVFVGHGTSNNTGSGNSFLGQDAGNVNAAGSQNTFVGRWAGFSNTGADSNTLVGFSAGKSTTGGSNAFFGANAGNANSTGSNNTVIGANADVFFGNNNFSTVIGAGAVGINSNEITLGRANGNDRVVIAGPVEISGQVTAFSGLRVFSGNLFLGALAAAGTEPLCRNGNSNVGNCSSSLRYKTNLAPYSDGLNILNRLRPITFDWKDGGKHDLGLGAEDVEKIDPLLVTYNAKGEVEGVKYDRIGVVLINAVKEQQAQIEAQQKQIETLTKALCSIRPELEICKQKGQ